MKKHMTIVFPWPKITIPINILQSGNHRQPRPTFCASDPWNPWRVRLSLGRFADAQHLGSYRIIILLVRMAMMAMRLCCCNVLYCISVWCHWTVIADEHQDQDNLRLYKTSTSEAPCYRLAPPYFLHRLKFKYNFASVNCGRTSRHDPALPCFTMFYLYIICYQLCELPGPATFKQWKTIRWQMATLWWAPVDGWNSSVPPVSCCMVCPDDEHRQHR